MKNHVKKPPIVEAKAAVAVALLQKKLTHMAMPIIASTATTICVFVPLIFLSSSGGGFMRFMTDLGVTVVVVMIASLLVALTVVPTVAAFLLSGETRSRSGLIDWMSDAYGKMIGFTIHHRPLFLISIVFMLWGSWWLALPSARSLPCWPRATC